MLSPIGFYVLCINTLIKMLEYTSNILLLGDK